MTETASERLGAIRTALRELVDEHGSELLSSPARMSNLIKDLLPDDQQLARILVIAAEQDVASKLREHGSQGMDAATATRLVATAFAASTMFDRQACLLVVGELAVAMGLASGESTTPVISDSGPPRPLRRRRPGTTRQVHRTCSPAPSAVSRVPVSPAPASASGAVPGSCRDYRVIVAAAVVLGIKIGSSAASHAPATHRRFDIAGPAASRQSVLSRSAASSSTMAPWP